MKAQTKSVKVVKEIKPIKNPNQDKMPCTAL